jgi:hypothetical protein
MSTPLKGFPDLQPALDAFTILSASSFTFAGGQPIQAAASAMQPALAGGHPLPQNPLVQQMQSVLYGYCYARRFTGAPVSIPQQQTEPLPESQFVQLLQQSNRTQPHWDHGWRIYALGPNGQVYVQKGEFQRTAIAGEFLSLGQPGTSPKVGDSVQVWVHAAALGLQPGFYFAFGEVPSDVWDDFSLVRYYFHSTAAAAPGVLEHVTAQLNRYRVPFRMKALTQPSHYDRADAIVLYAARRYFNAVARTLCALPDQVSQELRETPPLFTKKLQRGIGIAEEPNTGESFGMHRCRLTAEGILDAWMQGTQTAGARMQAVAARFESNRLKLEAPYLNPVSVDLFEPPKDVSIRR